MLLIRDASGVTEVVQLLPLKFLPRDFVSESIIPRIEQLLLLAPRRLMARLPDVGLCPVTPDAERTLSPFEFVVNPRHMLSCCSGGTGPYSRE